MGIRACPFLLIRSTTFDLRVSPKQYGQVQEPHCSQPEPQEPPQPHEEAQRQVEGWQQGTRPQVFAQHEVCQEAQRQEASHSGINTSMQTMCSVSKSYLQSGNMFHSDLLV